MSHPQPGLFIEETAQHLHVEWSFKRDVDAPAMVAAITAARRGATFLGGPNVVWGLDPGLWRRLSDGAIPDEVVAFQGVPGVSRTVVPVTQSSLWLWCHGNEYTAVWRAVAAAVAALAPVAVVDRHVRAYKGPDSRDPTGFIDGTENPLVDEALEVALVQAGKPGANGSPILVQKWVHDLAAFEALPLSSQQDVIGRTKADSIQLPPAVMPATSHVSRNTITDAQGDERHIYRRNTPYADVDEIGTIFIGACGDPSVTDTMLNRMFGAAPDGLSDELTSFSAPVSGSYYFAPAMEDLTAVFGPLAADDDDEAATGAAEVSGQSSGQSGGMDASLGIGSLR